MSDLVTIAKIWSLLRIKDAQVFQRSKSKWLKEASKSKSGFFHAYIKRRSIVNGILAFKVWRILFGRGVSD